MSNKIVTDQKRLINLIREVHAVLEENRTHTLRVKVPNGIAVNTYELRLVNIEAKFKFEASAPVNERSPRPMAGKRKRL